MEKKNILFIILAVFLSAIISGGGVFLWQSKVNKKLKNEAVNAIKQEMNTQILELQTKIELLFDPAANLDMFDEINMSWIRNDGKLMCLNGHKINYDYFDSLLLVESKNTEYEEIFTKAGYVKNTKNTLENGVDNFVDPRIGFEKGNKRCLISWVSEPGVDEYLEEGESFSYHYYLDCAEYTQEDEDNFNNFYSIVDAGVNNVENATVCVGEKVDDFAVGGVGFYRSGAAWFAHKENNGWVLDLITQDYPECVVVKDYPKSFYGQCYDENGLQE